MEKLFALLAIFALVFGLPGCDTGENIESKGTMYVHIGAASSLEIANDSRGFTFPDTFIGESVEVTIIIKNTGNGNIKLTGSPYVDLDGATAVFSISSPPETSTVSPGSSASFKIQFAPVNAVESYVYVSIPNNSENAPDFSFTVYGTGVRPKPIASVFYGDNEIFQNGTINAGEVRITQSKIIPVVIKNTGREVLTIDTDNITISGSDAAMFTQTTNPGGSVSVGGQTYFNIEYKPTRQGENNAFLTIPTNDSSRNPVVIYLQAIAGAAPKPTASVFYENNEISQDGTINAGNIRITQSKNIIVIIRNTGDAVLTVDTSNITITGKDADAFIKMTTPIGNISTSGQSSFVIKCEPTNEGECQAILTIPSNDHSRNPVVFYLQATAISPQAMIVWSDDAEGEMPPYTQKQNFAGYYRNLSDLPNGNSSSFYPPKNGSKSIAIGGTDTALLYLKVNLTKKAKLSFWYAHKRMTGNAYFQINGVDRMTWDTDIDWSFIEFDLNPGENNLIWKKDGYRAPITSGGVTLLAAYSYLSLDDILIYYTE